MTPVSHYPTGFSSSHRFLIITPISQLGFFDVYDGSVTLLQVVVQRCRGGKLKDLPVSNAKYTFDSSEYAKT